MTTFRFDLGLRSPAITVDDYRRRAARRIHPMAWAYLDGAAEQEATLRANRDAFGRWALRSQVLAGNESIDLSTKVAGIDLALPVMTAPTGVSGLAHWRGELATVEGAEAVGTAAVISTAASYSVEEIAAATSRPHLFQLYPWAHTEGDASEFTRSLIERARNAGYAGLVITVDSPAMGNRERERRLGMGAQPVLTPRAVVEAALRPRWTADLLTHRRGVARNFVDAGGLRAGVESVQRQLRLMRPELAWDDVAWVREQWSGPFYVKGILSADDAARAIDLGADGVVVSNHGGRQLDGAVAALDALPAVVAQIGDRAEVLFDSGIRRGSDVVKALCLGATAVLIGRPHLYGLAVGGAGGVQHVLEILRDEMTRAMTLMGVGSVSDLDESWVLPAAGSGFVHTD